MTWLWVALGGGAGTLARYAIALCIPTAAPKTWPWATQLVNVIGCCLLAVLAQGFAGKKLWGVDAQLVLGTGVMGGFTTYSTFNQETLAYASSGQTFRAALYVATTVLACAAAGLLGTWLGRSLA